MEPMRGHERQQEQDVFEPVLGTKRFQVAAQGHSFYAWTGSLICQRAYAAQGSTRIRAYTYRGRRGRLPATSFALEKQYQAEVAIVVGVAEAATVNAVLLGQEQESVQRISIHLHLGLAAPDTAREL